MTPRIVSFDLDGVVMDNPFIPCVLPRIRRLIRSGSRLSELTEEEAATRIDRAIVAEWSRRMEAGDAVTAFDWDDIYNLVSAAFGGPAMPSVARLVEECCRPECIRLLPGVREGIDLLHANGFRALALTNGYSHYQAPVLRALGVSDLFDALIAPNDVRLAKPDPAIFRHVGGLVAHVGDTLYADVLGAKRAGIIAVWLVAELPRAVLGVPPTRRPEHPEFEQFLRRQLAIDPHRDWYPDATPAQLTGDAVAKDVDEAARAVIELAGAAN